MQVNNSQLYNGNATLKGKFVHTDIFCLYKYNPSVFVDMYMYVRTYLHASVDYKCTIFVLPTQALLAALCCAHIRFNVLAEVYVALTASWKQDMSTLMPRHKQHTHAHTSIYMYICSHQGTHTYEENAKRQPKCVSVCKCQQMCMYICICVCVLHTFAKGHSTRTVVGNMFTSSNEQSK